MCPFLRVTGYIERLSINMLYFLPTIWKARSLDLVTPRRIKIETEGKAHPLLVLFLRHSFTRFSKCKKLKITFRKLGSQVCKHIQFQRWYFEDKFVDFKFRMSLIISRISYILQTGRWVGGIHSFFKSKFIQSDNNWSHAPDDLKGWLVWKKMCVKFYSWF